MSVVVNMNLLQEETEDLNEIAQVSNIKFAFGILKEETEEIDPVTPWFKCRDFFNDFFVTNQYPDFITSYRIYGYDSKAIEVTDFSKLLLLVKSPNEINLSSLLKNQSSFENEWGFSSSVVFPYNKKVLIIIPPREAINNNVAFSFYTAFLRYYLNVSIDVYPDIHPKDNLNMHCSDRNIFFDYNGAYSFKDKENKIKELISVNQKDILENYFNKSGKERNIGNIHYMGIIETLKWLA